MHFSFQVTSDGHPVSTVTPTTLANPNGPGAVITIVGNGPNATANIVGPHNDASDLWGILVVLAVIFLSIGATRWVFGGRRRGRRGVARPSGPPQESGR